MKTITVLIADDEPLARQRMRRLLDSYEISILDEEASCSDDVIRITQQYAPDIIFLDIHMPSIDGISLGKILHNMTPAPDIIYCTAYDQHAVEAFRVGAIDYLLKPVQSDQLNEALARIMKTEKNTMILKVPSAKGVEYIDINTVYYLHAEQKYTCIYHMNGNSLLNESLKSLETRLSDDFLRIHRNTLVAVRFICSMEKRTDNQWHIGLYGIKETLVVSRRCLQAARKTIKLAL